jgi:hypothetical protein
MELLEGGMRTGHLAVSHDIHVSHVPQIRIQPRYHLAQEHKPEFLNPITHADKRWCVHWNCFQTFRICQWLFVAHQWYT